MPPDETPSGRLSSKAFAKFKAAYSEEYPTDRISDEELHARAWGVLRIFDILLRPLVKDTLKVTNEEAQVLAYLHHSIYHKNRSPSVRDIAEVAGFRSSRSGMQIVNRFIVRKMAI